MGQGTSVDPVAALQALVRLPTVSYDDPDRCDEDAFEQQLSELARLFPRVHELVVRRMGRFGLLIHWPGQGSERPVVLMAHLDVVPVDEDAPWQHPAFDGVIEDGFLWGRGTLDDKGCVVGIASAVEQLLEAGHTPAQDVWLSFGCDEEVSGTGAQQAVDTLRDLGVEPWLVIDEGGAIAHEAFPGVKPPVAVIGVSEKGTAAIEIRAEGRGGHSSTPARNGPVARIATAITRLDRSPMPAQLPEATVALMQRLAPHAPPGLRHLMQRADSLKPVLIRALIAAGPEPAAMVRTTVATTTLSGSPANNVIASTATVGLNVRLMPGDSVEAVVDHVRRTVKDTDLSIRVVSRGEASPVSPWEDDAFRLIEDTVAAVFPDAIPSPYVMMAATDSRHFTAICPRVYRFAPFRMTKAQREAIHSYDERIALTALVDGVRWYRTFIERLPR